MKISISRSLETSFLIAVLALCQSGVADETTVHVDGHTKGRLLGQTFPDDSLFYDLTGSGSLDVEGDLRLNLEIDNGPWSLQSSYQLFTAYGDKIEYSRQLPAVDAVIFDRLPNDSRRLMDLTSVLQDAGKTAVLHRLDRLWVGYTGAKTVVRVGRQAITWGNGFFYSPMDIVNPFDPATIDAEYKAGDDMIYAQYLRDNGHDVQGAAVFRRNATTGEVESDEATYSVKYHGIVGANEFDVLIAQSFGDTTIGLGGNKSIGGSVLRGDIVFTDAEAETTFQLVTNLSYSWVWGGKNVSGVVEYYYNGFGQSDGDYSPQSLADNPELTKRIGRRELFTLAQHYVAGGITVEMTPLWTLTPNMFVNVRDPSAFFQLVSQRSLGDNAPFLGAINLPIGPSGSEFGGIESGLPDTYISTGVGAFLQIAWYF